MDTLIKRKKIFDNIIVPSGTKKEAIKIISRLCATHRLLDESTLEEAFWKREEWDPTGCGDGIAIPHAEWDAFDGKPVGVAFAIIAPEETGQEKYLSFLARLARKLVDEEFIESFRKCRNEEEMYEYLLSVF